MEKHYGCKHLSPGWRGQRHTLDADLPKELTRCRTDVTKLMPHLRVQRQVPASQRQVCAAHKGKGGWGWGTNIPYQRRARVLTRPIRPLSAVHDGHGPMGAHATH